MLEFSIVTISVFVSTLNEITKTLVKGVFKVEINRFIPLFSIVYGIGLAILAFYTGIENFGNNLVEAMFIGLSSGAAATGYHQIGKQLFKPVASTTNAEPVEDVDPIDDVETEDVEDVDVEDVTIDENPTVDDVTYDDEDSDDDYGDDE